MPQNSKMLIGAIIAAALAFAVYFGLISPQTASTVQTQANQTLGTAPASQQMAPQSPTAQAPTAQPPSSQTPSPQTPPAQTPAPTAPMPQPASQAPKQ